VKSDRVRPIRRARAEHAGESIPRISSWANFENIAARAIEPCEHDDLAPHLQIANPFDDVPVEHQPGVRRSFITLAGSRVAVDKR